jgi:serine/threonine protein kinase/WD40 repeat protein
MSDPPSEFDSIEEAAESFLERYRRGERPSLSEYTARYPELAERIRALFPALVVMEKVGSLGGESGPLASRAAAGDPKVPAQLGEYRLVRQVGRGGMGIVYEAVQESLGRHVALKVLPLHTALAPTHLERFRREAQAAAQLHHTNIVPVFGVGEHEGLHYYAMQFIQGQGLECVLRDVRDLRRRRGKTGEPGCVSTGGSPSVAQGLLSGQFVSPTAAATPGDAPRESSAGSESATSNLVVAGDDSELTAQSEAQYFRSVARVGVQVAEALAHAHQQGIIHRDIKPSNLLLDTRGTVWVTDFGLAKAVDADELTQTGDIVGTLRYMAPERFQGVTDARSDVYSLGATLYEMVTLRPAFDGADKLRLMERVTHEALVPPRRLDPRVPRDLETIILKAMDKDPQRRFQTATAMADELRLFLTNRPLQIRRSSLRERLWRWCRRNPLVTTLLSLVGVLLITVAVVASLAAWTARRQLHRTQQAERTATDRLFEALLTRVEAGRGSGQPGQRLANLEALRQAAEIARQQGRPAADLLHLRSLAAACLALPDLTVDREWEGNPPGTTGLGFDARLERYAWSFRDEGISVRRVEDHRELCRLPTPPSDAMSRWAEYHFSPDGRYLAADYRQWGQRRPLQVWDLQGSSDRPTLAFADVAAPPVFTADGRTLVVRLAGGAVAVIDLASGAERRRLAPVGAGEAVALHPGGRLLAVACGPPWPGCVRVLDLQTGAVARELALPAGGANGLAWAPDGRLLAAACGSPDYQIYLWDGLSGRKEGELTGHRWDVRDVAFDATGRYVASFGWDLTMRIWDVGSRRQVLVLEEARVVGFRTQGELGAACLSGPSGKQVRLWSFRPSAVHRELHFPEKQPYTISFSPNGRWAVTCGPGGACFRVWDLGAGREASHLPLVHGQVWDLWEPSGDGYLATNAEGLLRGRMPPAGGTEGGWQRALGRAGALKGLVEHLQEDGTSWDYAHGERSLTWRDSHVRMIELGRQTGRVLWQVRHDKVAAARVSPDGRLVATSAQDGGDSVRIWDADTGRLLHELPVGDAQAAFSQDSRQLYTATGRLARRGAELCAWRVGTWEPVRALPLNRIVSSPPMVAVGPGGTVAVVWSMQEVKLLEPETFTELVTLAAPEQDMTISIAMSGDGRTLGATSRETLHLWDLQALRRELRAINLDWDGPSSPPPGRPGTRRRDGDLVEAQP